MAYCANLRLTLLDETVLSSRSATAGEHQSLDSIPGSTLLGWAAAKLYKELDSRQAFQVFHSGSFRFGNGLPLTESGEIARPMPLCWHEDKGGEPALVKGRLDRMRLANFCFGKPEGWKQPRQLRNGYVSISGEVVHPFKSYRMKTAINPEKGAAQESQLFGYESLQRGQRFEAQITADEDVPVELFERVLDAFSKTMRIGRSRTAQYGRVKVDIVRNDTPVTSEIAGKESLTLWLQSDLALRDASGVPLLCPPDASLLGLPHGKLDISKSFVRFRSYVPYNAHYKCHDMDRQVIVAGSVLHFDLDQPLTEKDAIMLGAGLGCYREAGLGAVCVNHPLLVEAMPVFSESESNISLAAMKAPAINNDPLIALLKIRFESDSEEKEAKAWAESRRGELEGVYESARRYNGLLPADPIGPGRSQWRRVQDAAAGNLQQLSERLFVGDDCICKEKDVDWGCEFQPGNTFRGWLKNKVEQAGAVLHVQWLAKYAETLRVPGSKGGKTK